MQKIKFILISSLFILTFTKIFGLIAGAESTGGCTSTGDSEEEASSGTAKSLASAW